MISFKVNKEDPHSQARAGILATAHGEIPTPIFMPVGTLGSVKGLSQEELMQDIQASIILGNTYHLYLRPGTEVLQESGGLHRFIGWDKPILTDSGGYQIFSLADMRKIKPEGVVFRSHIDGSKHLFTPENNVEIQRAIGADLIMAFDECTPYPCDKKYARKSLQITHAWLERGWNHHLRTPATYDYDQLFIPIIQGSVYPDLRLESTEEVLRYDNPVYAIGGLSVGEPHEDMYAMTREVCSRIPVDRGRYLMGVGTPENLLVSIGLGIDLFDCVLPTRNARHGLLYTSEGVINIKNAKWKNAFEPIDTDSGVTTSARYSKAYLHHLIRTGEMLGARLASMQNLGFFLWLVKTARNHILEGTFSDWQRSMLQKVVKRL
ncbi:MAG: tRNA guanosine(34) transglycosylase Tgt [Saprospiraceae bacterium]|nr:tRNA guanosine(34) transglycosylase Tgt [Saprospiraceae bacterium]MCB9321648.1 tRNA guanosine(34) transglycosylase Tgt [Lewinellaceae bacterium]